MMSVTQPMAFDYEIAAAIYHMLDKGYTELAVDIPLLPRLLDLGNHVVQPGCQKYQF